MLKAPPVIAGLPSTGASASTEDEEPEAPAPLMSV